MKEKINLKEEIVLPEEVNKIINELNKHGQEAYVVGGCVRDSLLGKEPHDWDITTSAKPEETKNIFSSFMTLDTGLKHGTVSIVLDGVPYEVTTYRIDGDYADSRHPESVQFTSSLKEDLARRDFTINAMAYNKTAGIVDLYHGIEDLQDGIIRAVGDPEERFNEDALRIMRAIRFASRYEFEMDKDTENAIYKLKDNLTKISSERLMFELNKILLSEDPVKYIDKYKDVIAVIIPELKPMFGFNQNNPYHMYDVWDHTMKTLEHIANHDNEYDDRTKLILRLSGLLHDIGKPDTYTEIDGTGHFYGHPPVSAKIAEEILTRLRYPNDIKNQVITTVKEHDTPFIKMGNKGLKKALNRLGEENIKLILVHQEADMLAHSDYKLKERMDKYYETKDNIYEILENHECFQIKDLTINGNDLKNMGYTEGKEIGRTLNEVLDLVISKKLNNDRDEILSYIMEKENLSLDDKIEVFSKEKEKNETVNTENELIV